MENRPLKVSTVEKEAVVAIRCNAKIDGYSIELLLDSRASGSIVIEQFLKKIKRKID